MSTKTINRRPTVSRALTVGALALGLTLVGCQASSSPEQPSSTNGEQAEAQSFTYEGAWAKAASGMTGVFGTITNHTDEDFTLTGASTDAAHLVELHETVPQDGQMLMREVPGGFAISAGDSLLLEPGGNHIMLMEMPGELLPGEQFDLTLDFVSSSGTSETLTITADVRDFAGANEEYEGDHDHGDHHDH